MYPIVRLVRWLKRIKRIYITNSLRTPGISETRDIGAPQSREVKPATNVIPMKMERGNDMGSRQARTIFWRGNDMGSRQARTVFDRVIERCPYCNSKDIIKRGRRKKKYEVAQLYYCNHCKKTFTAPKAKGRSFPLKVILEGLCLYNIGHSAEESVRLLKEQFGLDVSDRTLREWVSAYEHLCRYSRMRPYGLKLYSPHQVIQTVHLFHRQVYDFSVHRAKLALILTGRDREQSSGAISALGRLGRGDRK